MDTTVGDDKRRSPRPLSGRASRKKALTRTALIEAAQRFLASGDTNAPINAITDAADLGIGSFYNHFASKTELFDAAVADALERHADYIENRALDMSDPAAVFSFGFRLTGRLHRRQPLLSKVVLNQGLLLLNSSTGLIPRARRDIRAATDAGRFLVANEDAAMITVTGAGLCLGQMIHDRPDIDDAALTDQVTADLMRMLGMKTAEADLLSFAPLPDFEARRPVREKNP